MIERFFKLIYVVSLIGIVISLPIYLIKTIRFDEIVITSYKAKCSFNNQYVVLEGSQLNQPYVFDEILLKNTTITDTKKNLNFYCKNYDDIRPYVIGYLKSKTLEERMAVNRKYFEFEEEHINDVYSYPPLYRLEVVNNETKLYRVYGPILDWIIIAILVFLFLQILKIFYTYIMKGKIVLNPFK